MNARRRRRNAPRPDPVHVVSRRSQAAASPSRRLRRYEAAVPMAVPAARRSAGGRLRMPRVHLQRRHWAGLTVLLLAAVIVLALTLPVFRLTDVQVTGLEQVSAAEVVAALEVQGRSIWGLRPAKLEAALLAAYPEFVSVQVERHFWPPSLAVSVVERQPIAAILQDGRLYLVDAEGVLFLPRQEAPPLPTVTAFAPLATGADGRISPALAQGMAELGAAAPADARLIYDARYGLGWQTASGQRVFVGHDPRALSLQLRIYQALNARLMQEGVQPLLVDLGDPHAPYFKAGY